MSNEIGEIPSSDALAEAGASESLLELLSKDPFSLQRQDRNRVVAALREQRARWEAAEASGAKPKSTKTTSNAVQSLLTQKKAGDLGL